MDRMNDEDRALLALQGRLAEDGYRFVTVTPATHARVLRRGGGRPAESMTDIFGWSMAFAPDLLPPDIHGLLRAGGMLDDGAALHRSRVRVSTLGGRNHLHSAYPTTAADSVFLGPDSYRFADLIAAELATHPAPPGARVADIGVGAGAGAITAASLLPDATVVASDLNPAALRLARINAAQAGVSIRFVQTSGLDDVPGAFDLALLNPPYIVDSQARAYRHGGGMHGGQLALDLARTAMTRLAPRGRLILYTGSAILGGDDPLRRALADAAAAHGCAFRCREIDPDIFGEELDEPAYAAVDRIAAIGAVFTRTA